jgi:signal peptidase I
MENNNTSYPPNMPSQPVMTPDLNQRPHRPPQKKSDGLKSALSTIAILLAAPLVAVILIQFVFQSYEVDGPSMETTLSDRDRLIVWKVPRTIARFSSNSYIPKRGDIIVFRQSSSYEGGYVENKQLIKRVIGLPGDRVVIRSGEITIYNDEHPTGYNPDEEAEYGKVIKTTNGNVDIVVGENEVYVCGDNRVNSLDSRTFGAISADDIVGELAFRVFPLNKAESF